MSRVAVVGTICLGLLGLPAPSLAQAGEVEERIHEANGRFIGAVRAMDAVAVASLYTSDAKILPPNGDFVTGPEAITAFWQGFFDLGFNDARPVTLEVIPMGESALEVGTYTLVGADGTVLDRGKIMVLWKKEGDVWKMHRDTWNSSVPLPAPEGDAN